MITFRCDDVAGLPPLKRKQIWRLRRDSQRDRTRATSIKSLRPIAIQSATVTAVGWLIWLDIGSIRSGRTVVSPRSLLGPAAPGQRRLRPANIEVPVDWLGDQRGKNKQQDPHDPHILIKLVHLYRVDDVKNFQGQYVHHGEEMEREQRDEPEGEQNRRHATRLRSGSATRGGREGEYQYNRQKEQTDIEDWPAAGDAKENFCAFLYFWLWQ